MTQMSIEQALQMAMQQHQMGNIAQAEQMYHQVLAVAPQHPDALHLAGVAAMDQGRPGEAVELIGRAISMHPAVADFHYNLGVALMDLQQKEQALGAFQRALQIKPDALNARANIAGVLLSLKRFAEAIEVAKSVLAIDPNNPDALNNLGVGLKETNHLPEAIACYERSLAIRPNSVETLTNLGNALQREKRYDESLAVHSRAVALRPDVAQLHNNLGSVLYDMMRYPEAIQCFERAIAILPAFPEAMCSLCNSFYRDNQLKRAIDVGLEVIRKWPEWSLPKFNVSLMLLLDGRFKEGWEMNEVRWSVNELGAPRYDFNKPRWDGSDLHGKTILLYGEQGFGDTIQFARYIPMVLARGGRIILGCQTEVVRLLQQMKGVENVFSSLDPATPFDVHCPLMSLPGVFGTDLSNIPSSPKYLQADPALAATWRERIPNDPNVLKIGLTWAGRPTHDNDRNRSIALAALAPLADVKGTWFCSLQKGPSAKEAKSPPNGMQIADFSEQINDFADTAAVIEHLDMVISVDTAAAHLAAAMGKPTWILLPVVPDWRWLMDREDSPWYPTVRLFRQKKLLDWMPTIRRLTDELRQRISG